MLDAMLFKAAEPAERYRMLERFYRLDPGLIGRFYADDRRMTDKARRADGQAAGAGRPRDRARSAGSRRMKTARSSSAQGSAGWRSAIRLQSAGVETTIVEARDKPGGRAYFWEKDGFTFDAGPTVITDPPCLKELWALTGRDMAEDVTLDAGAAFLPAELAPTAPASTIPTTIASLHGRDRQAQSRGCRRLSQLPRIFGRGVITRAMRSSAMSRFSTSPR